MRTRDCCRIAFHTIKENRSRSILTVVISTFLSALIMGMLCLAVSFAKNGGEIIGKAFFPEKALVSVNYNNAMQTNVMEQRYFQETEYPAFLDAVGSAPDMVQSIYYTTNIASEITYTDPSYPVGPGLRIVEGRNIAVSEAHNEVIVSKEAYEKSFEGEEPDPYTIGSVHTRSAYVRDLWGWRSDQYGYPEFVVVGIFEYTGEKIVLNGNVSPLSFGQVIGDIGIAFTTFPSRAIVESFSAYHRPQGKVSDPEGTINRLNALADKCNAVLPKRITVEYFETDRILHYTDTVSCPVYEQYASDKTMRSVVISAAALFALILLLMSVGSLANSAIISIDRSKKFFGLAKALGMRGRSLKSVVFIESAFLVSVGVLLGYLLLWTMFTPLTSLINLVVASTYGAFV
ncbi:MAG: hypothetical protein IJU64_00595 [Bacilli bacterium]|nr:hypothetical protein [Bacilli bacterium]